MLRQPALEVGPMTSVILGWTASDYLALEARGPTVYSLERAVQAVEVVGPIFLVF